MRFLRLAVAGLVWRRGISVLLLVIATITTAAAAAAPSYAASAQDATLIAAVARAPVGSQGTGLQVSVQVTGRPSTAPLRAAIDSALQGSARAAYSSIVTQLSVVQRVTAGGEAPAVALVDRDGVCRQLRIVAGRCVSEADRNGVVIEQSAARKRGVHVGTRFSVRPLSDNSIGDATALVVRGIAVRREAESGYWFDGDADQPASVLSLWAPRSYFSALRVRASDLVQATADLVLNQRAVHLQSVAALTDGVDFAARTLEAGRGEPTVTYGLGQVLRSGVAAGDRLLLPIVVSVAELLALGWYLLHSLMAGAADARGGEVALAKLRGLTGGRTLLLVVLEPALLLGLAVPLGVLLAGTAEYAFARQVLGDVDVIIGWPSWVAAGGAAVGGLVATAAASIAVLRRPVLEQWRRSSRDTARRSLIVETVVVALAIAGVVQLQFSSALGSGAANGIALIAPMLLLVAGALVASRGVVLLARAAALPTRATGAVAAFVGLRQLGRRPAGRRTFAVLVVAVALALYALSSTVVTATNREQRALTEVGAPTVLHIAPDSRTAQRLRTVDPSGRTVTAVAEVPVDADLGNTVAASSMLVIDPQSFASVAYWRHNFGPSSLPSLLRPLAIAPLSPHVTGTALGLTVDGRTVAPSLTLRADLVDGSGRPVNADLGALRRGSATYRAPVACASGCDLRRIYVTQNVVRSGDLVAEFVIRDARGLTGRQSVAADPSVTAAQWSGLNPLPNEIRPAETVAVADSGIEVKIAVRGNLDHDTPGFGVLAGDVIALPALVTSDLSADSSFPVAVTTLDAVQAPLEILGRVAVLPRLGGSGVVVTRDWLAAASPSGTPREVVDQVWVAGERPARTVRRLRAAGVEVLSIDRANLRSAQLAAQGPNSVAALTVATGVVAVFLGAAAIVLGLAQLARRRVFELSAMRALGIRRRSLFGSVLVEQAGLILGAAVVGLLLALLSVRLALPALPAYADEPLFPPFVVDQPIGLLLIAGAAIALVLVVAAAGTAIVLTRSASVSRLREAEQ